VSKLWKHQFLVEIWGNLRINRVADLIGSVSGRLLLFMVTQYTCMYYRPPEKRATMNGDYASKSTFGSRILPARHRELCAEFCAILIDLCLRGRTPALLRGGYTRRCEYAAPTQQVAVHTRGDLGIRSERCLG